MKTLTAIKKIGAFVAGISMIGATLTGAMASNLGDLSAFHGATIVVGDGAAAEDVVGAIDIAAAFNLPTAGKSTEALAGASTSDKASFSEPGDILEVGEQLGNVKESFTDEDLAGLQSGIIQTGKGRTDYNQFLKFEDSDGVVVHEEDENDDVNDYLRFREDEQIFEYVLEFEDGLESDIDNNDKLEDLEDEQVNILGTTFDVVNAEVDGDDVTIELFAGSVMDTLEEGETRTYTVEGKEVKVHAIIVSDTRESVKFSVNGAISDELQRGETDVVNGITLGVRDIMPNEAEEESGGDIVEFYLGVNKIVLKDDFTDADYTQGVEVNEEDIEDASVKITATQNGDKLLISSLSYKLDADGKDGDIHISPGHALSEYLDEPDGLLHSSWDIRYEGLQSAGTTDIVFDAKNDESYRLKFTNAVGNEYDLDLVTNKDNLFKYGDDDHMLVFDESVDIAERDSFILTNKDNEKGTTYVLEYEGIDDDDNVIRVKDVSSGNSKEFTYTGTEGVDAEGTMTIGGNSYEFSVNNGLSINVDLNNDDDITNDQVRIVVKGGGIIELDDNLGDGTMDATLTTLAKQFDNSNVDEVLDITVTQLAGEEVDIDVDGVDMEEVQNDIEEGLTPYGVKVRLEDENNDPNELTISYPSGQSSADVFVTTGTPEQVEPTTASEGVMSAKLASEWDGNGNVIVVGGPCINSVYEQFAPYAGKCADGFVPGEAIIKLVQDGDRVALLVAGYEAGETRMATNAIRDGLLDGLTSTEALVVQGRIVAPQP